MAKRTTAVQAACGALLVFWAAEAAASLTGTLDRFFDRNAFPVRGRVFSQLVTPLVERIALRGVDLPVAATSPAFAYRFDFEGGAPERLEASLGPVFVERVETLGRGRGELGLTVLHANLDRWEGGDFARRIRLTGTVPTSDGDVTQGFAADDFELIVDTAYLSLTCGLGARWDVNLLQPLVVTTLQLGGRSRASFGGAGRPTGRASASVGTEADAFGAGDTMLRTKYRLPAPWTWAAVALTLRLPVGDPDDFHGSGDVRTAPTLVLSRTVGPHDLHVNLGWDLDATDVARSRATYAAGVSLRVSPALTLLLDVLGGSGVAAERFTVPVAGFPQSFGLEELVVARRPDAVVAEIPRTDVVDLAAGLKLAVVRGVAVSLSALVPLTDDGLRARVLAAGSVEVRF